MRRPLAFAIAAAASSQVGLGARDDHHVAAFRRQALGAGPADPFAAAGDQRHLVFQAQIHPDPPMVWLSRDLA